MLKHIRSSSVLMNTKRFYTTTIINKFMNNSSLLSSSSAPTTTTTEHTPLGDFPFTQTQYIGAINRTVDRITEVLDKFYDSEVDNLEEKGMDLEVEGGHDGVVNIKVTTSEDKLMVFVVSRQTPARELWLSSAISGPWHYRYDHVNDDWICTREGHLKFWQRMEKELSQVLEQEIKF
ncbi:frataxin [Naegleria gruberi]|uniref:Frataxin n=1 Tax=Naegleria gruberi TaxID=5762 RepID=D2V2J1_NAEGR|nr:frataxin [Naegleria gruberi]EFC48907.1 frataxin [Naegleria gruberi]|eukprot:XP_002681651.1 frataxin [Naegleria gruberi]